MDATGLRTSVTTQVARMVDYETEFWVIADGMGLDRARAGCLLDTAVSWIGSGRGATCDPYALALSWIHRG
ncbi:hypothetical protein V5P93_005470 [Actinokineospora auranticolor]|uniref:Uncharacterized protein n=1 Tax=Actinokineospora auranticolor TaxID=155976 RepID=A0A2S6GQM5_9PSEU|nr:hypothetical protein [Actinokineospora auranticolor]PPK67499.1 hypothetical protein CLV40_107163 [Actinokineospora auranticolor]